MLKTVTVAAAVVERGEEILLSSRPSGSFMEGFWEFPGGKIEQGEGAAEALRRELHEELGIENLIVLDTLFSFVFNYPDKQVNLTFMRCRVGTDAVIKPMENQKFRWCARSEIAMANLLPADDAFIRNNFPQK